MTTATPTKNVRLTITVSPEVHQVFQRLAKASSMPTGRAMGDWLGDTIAAAELMAKSMERARAAPKLVAQELHAYALGLGDETGELLRRMREKGEQDRAGDRAKLAPHEDPARSAPAPTPPSNTGVTTTNKKPKRGTK